MGLASQWQCVTEFSGLCGLTAYAREMSTPDTPGGHVGAFGRVVTAAVLLII